MLFKGVSSLKQCNAATANRFVAITNSGTDYNLKQKVMQVLLGLFVSATLLEFIVNSCVLNPDRMQCVPPITFLSKRPAALDAAETLWVPVLIQSGDHFLNDKRSEKLNGFRWVGGSI